MGACAEVTDTFYFGPQEVEGLKRKNARLNAQNAAGASFQVNDDVVSTSYLVHVALVKRI